MCLYTKQNNPETAREYIECYKIMIVKRDGKAVRLESFYYDHKWIPGKIYSFDESGATPFEQSRGVVSHGFHAYEDYAFAESIALCLGNIYARNGLEIALALCRIPEGARYFTGFDGFRTERDENPACYCADKIGVVGWRHPGPDGGEWRRYV